MRVLQLISSGGLYGMENMLLSFAHSLQKAGHEPVLGVFHNRHRSHTEIAEAAQHQGLKVKMIECQGKLDGGVVSGIQQYLKSERIELLHTHGYKSDVYGYIAARRLHIPVLTTQHSMEPLRSLLMRFYRALDLRLIRKFDKVIAVSETIAGALQRQGVPAEKITTIANGVRVSDFVKAQPNIRAELGATGLQIIGLVGRLIPDKGGRDFLHAARELADEFPAALFVFVGEGPYRDALGELAQELGIEQRVVFAGMRRDMPAVYASLDMIVLPSLSEGLPMTILEAMAAKKPVIATKVGGIPSVVWHERTGLLVEPRDVTGLRNAMARLLGDPTLGRQLGECGHQLILQEFSAESAAQKYIALYGAAIGRNRGDSKENVAPPSTPERRFKVSQS